MHYSTAGCKADEAQDYNLTPYILAVITVNDWIHCLVKLTKSLTALNVFVYIAYCMLRFKFHLLK